MSVETADFYMESLTGYQIRLLPEEIKEICDSCPVKQECSNYAVVHEEYGIWGGETASERRKRRKAVLTNLAVDAVSNGWLENHHLIPAGQLQEIRAAMEAKNRKKPKKVPLPAHSDLDYLLSQPLPTELTA